MGNIILKEKNMVKFCRKIILLFMIFIFSLYVIFPEKAYAYIDPGTGSYIFQLIVGAFLGGLFAIKLSWRRIFGFFGKLNRRKSKDGKNIQ